MLYYNNKKICNAFSSTRPLVPVDLKYIEIMIKVKSVAVVYLMCCTHYVLGCSLPLRYAQG